MSNPAHSEIRIDNEKVRVTRWHFTPGTETGRHRHEYDIVVVPITSGQLQMASADGSVTTVELEAGSPYGYFLRRSRALVMNIATGGGTLVHEMVHAMMAYDFPNAPTWLDEGVASLFECCTIEDGRILGRVNWRLPVLCDGFHDKRFVHLEELLTMPERTFRNSEASMHYAESRYLCLYMQEKKVQIY